MNRKSTIIAITVAAFALASCGVHGPQLRSFDGPEDTPTTTFVIDIGTPAFPSLPPNDTSPCGQTGGPDCSQPPSDPCTQTNQENCTENTAIPCGNTGGEDCPQPTVPCGQDNSDNCLQPANENTLNCQDPNAMTCVEDLTLPDVQVVCDNETQVTSCTGLAGLPTQVDNAPRYP